MESLIGKTALVTGAGSGIGRATAIRLAEDGVDVGVVELDEESGRETVETIRDLGQSAVFVQTDVSDESQVESMVPDVENELGSIDLAFNNAGVAEPGKPLVDRTIQEWDRVMDVNSRGTWLCLKQEIRSMLESGGGTIVNMASVAGQVGFAEHSAYSTSKHGVVGLTKTAALEYIDEGIRINAVCPSFVDTPMLKEAEDRELIETLKQINPTGRLGRPDEIADAVAWLLSEQSSYVVGHALTVDGGLTAT